MVNKTRYTFLTSSPENLFLSLPGGKVKNWKERWFKLYKEGYIQYFESDVVCAKMIGVLMLTCDCSPKSLWGE